MHATTPMRMRAGAFGLAVACAGLGLCGIAAAQALPAIKPGQIGSNFEPPTHRKSDQVEQIV